MKNTNSFLAIHGSKIALLAGYQKSLVTCDIKEDGYCRTVAEHHNIFLIAIPENPGIDPKVMYPFPKLSSSPVSLTLPYCF